MPVLDFGGVESRIALQAHSERSYDLRVCTFWKDGAAAQEVRSSGVPVDVLGVPPRPTPRAIGALARYLRQQKPDVLHCSISEANFLGLVAGTITRVPVRIVEEVGMPAHGLAGRIAFRTLYSSVATLIIGVTEAVCDYVRRVDRAPTHRVRRVYNCAHPRFFPDTPRTTQRVESKRNALLMVGRLHPVKNHETVLRALARTEGLTLRIVGDGPLKEKVLRQRDELGLVDRVHLAGYQDNIVEQLGDAGAFVLASHDEGCSISLIEAMATGLPALGSDVPGIREVMGNTLADQWTVQATDVEGWCRLFDQYQNLGTTRPTVASEFQRRAYDNFSPARYLETLDQIYSSLTEST